LLSAVRLSLTIKGIDFPKRAVRAGNRKLNVEVRNDDVLAHTASFGWLCAASCREFPNAGGLPRCRETSDRPQTRPEKIRALRTIFFVSKATIQERSSQIRAIYPRSAKESPTEAGQLAFSLWGGTKVRGTASPFRDDYSPDSGTAASPAVADGAGFVLPVAARTISQPICGPAPGALKTAEGGGSYSRRWPGLISSHSRHRANPKSRHNNPVYYRGGPGQRGVLSATAVVR
jgi:hypothetical protein